MQIAAVCLVALAVTACAEIVLAGYDVNSHPTVGQVVQDDDGGSEVRGAPVTWANGDERREGGCPRDECRRDGEGVGRPNPCRAKTLQRPRAERNTLLAARPDSSPGRRPASRPLSSTSASAALGGGAGPRSRAPRVAQAGMRPGLFLGNLAITAGSRLSVAATISGGVWASQSESETSS